MDYGKNTKKLELAEAAIAKAKELLVELGENNGMMVKDESEIVKVKRPKAKSEKTKMPKDANKAFAGDTNTVAKASGTIAKRTGNEIEQYQKFVRLIRDALQQLTEQGAETGMPTYIIGDIKSHLKSIQELLDRV